MKKFLPVIILVILVVMARLWLFGRNQPTDKQAATPTKAPPAPVNQIPLNDRPYVILEPLAARNELKLTIFEPKIKAKTVEIALEYDRNKGVLDSVLKQFKLTNFPYQDTLFLGSKSAGGHITYHDDVIGGKYTLTFDGGDKRYALENPWRYDDTQKSYSEISTADGKFQVVFEKPFATPKVIIMQSPGLPLSLAGEVVAGPYLFRGVGALPKGNLAVKIRLSDDLPGAKLFGWDGAAWQTIPTTLDGKTLSASTLIYEAYVVSN